MSNQEVAVLEQKAFKSEEEYNKYINLSNKIDTFCTQAKILETVANSNKYLEATLDFCDNNGDIQNTIKLFSPVLNDTLGEREIFAQIGSKVVRLGVETTFEGGGARLGQVIGSAIVTAGVSTPPSWIMGTLTGGAFYLGGKYVGVAFGHYAEKYSYDEFLKFYDKYLEQTDSKDKVDTPIEVLNKENNKTTIFEPNIETKQLEPILEIDLINKSVVSLKEGQTISHIAQNTAFSSIDLLEYNNLSQEEAKNLPVGYKVLVPKDPPLEIQGEYGVIKLFKNQNDSFTLRIPDENNNKINITYNDNTDLLIYGDNTNPNKISFILNGRFEVWEKDERGVMY
ncbi:hypothetical protein CRU99_13795, partial [Malaciobacter mytili]|uniref:hypothetical protein n=1 Tax=Malaciobacter mytili TaxID=603050 RepID=UPI0010256452